MTHCLCSPHTAHTTVYTHTAVVHHKGAGHTHTSTTKSLLIRVSGSRVVVIVVASFERRAKFTMAMLGDLHLQIGGGVIHAKYSKT